MFCVMSFIYIFMHEVPRQNRLQVCKKIILEKDKVIVSSLNIIIHLLQIKIVCVAGSIARQV